MTTPPRLLADRMPCANTPSRRYRCAASSLTARSLRARVRHEARGFSVRKPSDEVLRQHLSTSVRLHLKFAAELFKEWGPPLGTVVHTPYRWSDDESWRERYMEVRPENRAKLAAEGEARRAQRVQVHKVRR